MQRGRSADLFYHNSIACLLQLLGLCEWQVIRICGPLDLMMTEMMICRGIKRYGSLTKLPRMSLFNLFVLLQCFCTRLLSTLLYITRLMVVALLGRACLVNRAQWLSVGLCELEAIVVWCVLLYICLCCANNRLILQTLVQINVNRLLIQNSGVLLQCYPSFVLQRGDVARGIRVLDGFRHYRIWCAVSALSSYSHGFELF